MCADWSRCSLESGLAGVSWGRAGQGVRLSRRLLWSLLTLHRLRSGLSPPVPRGAPQHPELCLRAGMLMSVFSPLTSLCAPPWVLECKHVEWSELPEAAVLGPGWRGHLQGRGCHSFKYPRARCLHPARDPGEQGLRRTHTGTHTGLGGLGQSSGQLVLARCQGPPSICHISPSPACWALLGWEVLGPAPGKPSLFHLLQPLLGLVSAEPHYLAVETSV